MAVFSVAMAYLEAAVVVYLRALYYPGGFVFPLLPIPDRIAAIEVAREAATIAMLACVAWLAGERRGERFPLFCVGFGIWDLLFYAWLRILIGWPPRLMTWDILFLIPVPWTAPVLAPVIVSVALLAGGTILLVRRRRGWAAMPAVSWAAGAAGGAFVLAAFTLDHAVVLAGGMPPPFRWGLFGAGMALATAGLARAIARRA